MKKYNFKHDLKKVLKKLRTEEYNSLNVEIQNQLNILDNITYLSQKEYESYLNDLRMMNNNNTDINIVEYGLHIAGILYQ